MRYTTQDQLTGCVVQVYRNLNKKCWSVVDLEMGEDYGRVIAHLDEITLSCPQFKVSQAGRLRVLREEVKNVHAKVRGEAAVHLELKDLDECTQVRYNPYVNEFFVDDKGQKVTLALTASFTKSGLVYIEY